MRMRPYTLRARGLHNGRMEWLRVSVMGVPLQEPPMHAAISVWNNSFRVQRNRHFGVCFAQHLKIGVMLAACALRSAYTHIHRRDSPPM